MIFAFCLRFSNEAGSCSFQKPFVDLIGIFDFQIQHMQISKARITRRAADNFKCNLVINFPEGIINIWKLLKSIQNLFWACLMYSELFNLHAKVLRFYLSSFHF